VLRFLGSIQEEGGQLGNKRAAVAVGHQKKDWMKAPCAEGDTLVVEKNRQEKQLVVEDSHAIAGQHERIAKEEWTGFCC
jgi:hypothetical protein